MLATRWVWVVTLAEVTEVTEVKIFELALYMHEAHECELTTAIFMIIALYFAPHCISRCIRVFSDCISRTGLYGWEAALARANAAVLSVQLRLVVIGSKAKSQR